MIGKEPDTLGMLDILTKNHVAYNITNLVIKGLDANGQVEYRPEHHCVIRFAGRDLYCFIGDTFERVVRDAFVKAVECGLVLHC